MASGPVDQATLGRLTRQLAEAIASNDADARGRLIGEAAAPILEARAAIQASPRDPAARQALADGIEWLLQLWVEAASQLMILTGDGVVATAVADLFGDQTPTVRLEPGDLRRRLFQALEEAAH